LYSQTNISLWNQKM